MKYFFENWGFLIYLVLVLIFLFFMTPKQEISEQKVELQLKIEELEKENELLKDNYCKIKPEDLYCISYLKEKEELESLMKEYEESIKK